MVEYVGAGRPVLNFSNVDKGINTLAINLNLIRNIRTLTLDIRTLETLQIFDTTSKKH